MNDISHETAPVAKDADNSESMGRFLKQERLRQNKSLKEVAEATCIHISTIEALEEENRTKLPAEVFVRGFISIYAQYLKLDPQEALNRYGRKMATEWVSPGTGYESRKMPAPTAAHQPGSGGRWLVLFGLAAAALFGLWIYRQALPPAADQPAGTAQEEMLSSEGRQAEEAERRMLPGSSPEAVTDEQAREEGAAPLPGQDQQTTTGPVEAAPGGSLPVAPATEQAVPPAAAPPAAAPPAAAPPAAAPQAAAPRAAAPPEAAPPEAAPPAASSPAAATPKAAPPAAPQAASGTRAEAPAVPPAGDAPNVLEAKFTQTTWVRVRLDGRDPAEYLFQPGERYSWKADTIEIFLGNAGGVDLVLNGEPQPSPGPLGKTARLQFSAPAP